jgi:hypothetical protein
MGKLAQRNEYGLTEYQAKRYEAIIDAMESVFDSKKRRALGFGNTLTPEPILENVTAESILSFNRELELNAKSFIDEIIKFFDNEYFKSSSVHYEAVEQEKFDRAKMSIDHLSFVFNDIKELIRIIKKNKGIIERNNRRKEINKQVFDKKSVLKDMLALSHEFETFSFNKATKILYVTTKDIILNDGHDNMINLGPFKISYKTDSTPLWVRAKAIEPVKHYTSNNFHPHVQANGEICLGEGARALSMAHSRNAVFDVFLILKNLLNTYNPNSPYAKLETWMGRPCAHCGNPMGRNKNLCHVCGDYVCQDCTKIFVNPYGSTKIICMTCTSEEKNKCPGVSFEEENTCTNFIDPRTMVRCNSCHRRETEFAIKEKECDSCKTITPIENLVECEDCGQTVFCSSCAKSNTCEFCGKVTCPSCMSVCSVCGTPTHTKCLTENNTKLICTHCLQSNEGSI